MDWLIGLVLIIVGAIGGFTVAMMFFKENSPSPSQESTEETIIELLQQQAVSHVQEAKMVAQQLLSESTRLKQQIEDYEQLIITQKQGGEDPKLRFFGEHTTAYLRNKNPQATREKSTAEVQPLDFSSQSSGLFSGEENSLAKEVKE